MIDQIHLSSLFENATEGILLTNADGKVILANPAAINMFGYSPDELYGNTVDILLPRNLREKHTALRNSFYQHPQNRSMGSGRDLYACRKDGTGFPVEVSLSHYKLVGQTYVIAFIVDISLRKGIESDLIKKQQELENVTNQLRKLNTELEKKVDERTHILREALQELETSQHELSEALDKERQLNEIKSRFVSMASHEFRTPLSAVLSSASLLSKYTHEEEQEKRDRHINRIKESVKHLNDILEDFLSLGRLDEGRIAADPVEFNLRELLDETLSDLKLIIKKGQYFKVDYNGHEQIIADKKLLKNVIINLVSNAVKFSGEDAPININSIVNQKEARLSIRDKGIGISESDQEHLFSSFFRGANVTNIQGTGLGLHIVKRYVDLLNGNVHLQSQLGKGTTITITIPVNQKNNT